MASVQTPSSTVGGEEVVHEIAENDEYGTADVTSGDDDEYGVGTDQGMADDDGDDIAVDMSQNFARDVLKPGTYNGVIAESNYGLSQRSNKPMITCVLSLEVPEKGEQRINWYGSFSEKAIAGTMRTLKALVPQLVAQFTEGTNFRPKRLAEAGVLVGMPVRVITNVRLLDGEKVAGVRRIMKGTGGSFAQAG